MEIELQASVDKGAVPYNDGITPSDLSLGTAAIFFSLELDCASPCNIDDADIHVHMKELPPLHPITVFTDSPLISSFGSLSSSSMQRERLRRK
jgi:hypothetical protein